MSNWFNSISTSKLLHLFVSLPKHLCSIRILCIFLQLYIFAILKLCMNIMYTYLHLSCIQYFQVTFCLFSTLKIKMSCSNQVIKIQHKPYLALHWHLCQTWTSPLVAQLGKPKAEGLSLNCKLFAAFNTVCLIDLIILSSSALKSTVILVQVLKEGAVLKTNWSGLILNPNHLEGPARSYFHQNGTAYAICVLWHLPLFKLPLVWEFYLTILSNSRSKTLNLPVKLHLDSPEKSP